MEIVDLLTPDAVLPTLKTQGKKQLLQELSEHAARLTGIPERRIFETLVERERLGSTGMGQGIAIPHGRLAGLSKITGLFARLDSPVSYDSVDNQPVDLVFLLLMPASAGSEHMSIMAAISRRIRDDDLASRLRKGGTPATLCELLAKAK